MSDDNKPMKYLRYAIGEIVLVVIGILIALSINNWNEGRKEKKVEIDILEGIRNDILKDTIDINSNIRFYESFIKKDSLLFNELINKKKQSKEMVHFLINLTFADRTIVLYDSHFQEAKFKGLSIISNKNLKEKISRLYEWHYKNLILAENSLESTNYTKMLDNELGQYFGYDSTGLNISKSNYDRLLSNSNNLYYIRRGLYLLRGLQKEHQKTLENAINVVESIDKELIELKK